MVYVNSATDYQKPKQNRQKNDCNSENLQHNKIVTDNIPTSTLFTHYLQYAKKHCQKRNYVQNHININISIVLLYGILQITVLFDMCAAFALGALYNFQISPGGSGGKGKGTEGSCPLSLPPSGCAHAATILCVSTVSY